MQRRPDGRNDAAPEFRANRDRRMALKMVAQD